MRKLTLLILLASTACGTYSVRRAALVPHQQPVLRSGQPMGNSQSEFSVGASSFVNSSTPTEQAGANAGLEIPVYQLNAAARVRVNENFDMGLIWDHGLEQGATPLAKNQPSPDGGDVYGGGVSLFYSAQTGDPRFRIGLLLDLLMYSIPVIEYTTLVEPVYPGQPMNTYVDKYREEIAVFNLGLIPSFRATDNVTVYGSMSLRNHPTAPRGSIEQGFDSEDVNGGPVNIIVSGGVEYAFDNGVRTNLYIYQPVVGGPVSYGPTVGVGFTVPLSRDKTPTPPSAGPAR